MSTIVENEGTYGFPMMPLDSSTQTTKILNECAQVPTKRSKIQFDAHNEIKKIPSETTAHKSLLKLKKQIQNLIDFQSPRIALKEIPTNDFSKNIEFSKNFRLITLDGEPVPELMLCNKCNQVRARGRLSSTPIVRHLKQHEKVEKSRKIEQKKKAKKTNNNAVSAVSLTYAMKNSIPITKIGQECGEKLPHDKREEIVEMVLRQGKYEDQITLCKNLKRDLCNKIHLEKSEQKKKELAKELRALESISYAVKYRTLQKIPQLDNRLPSQISLAAPKNTHSRKSSENVMPSPIPEVINTGSLLSLGVPEMGGAESISSEHFASDESEKSSSVIAENDIKLKIDND